MGTQAQLAAVPKSVTDIPQQIGNAAHLLALRTAEPEPIIEPEPDSTGLHSLLDRV